MSRSYPEKVVRRLFRKTVLNNLGFFTKAFLIIAVVFFGSFYLGGFGKTENVNVVVNEDASGSDFNVYYIDVGQGDCTLIESGGKYMLIDAGEPDKGSLVVKYLKKLGVEGLEVVVGTHPDSDHIGGIEEVLKNFKCNTLLLSILEEETTTSSSLKSYLNTNGYKVTGPRIGDKYRIGNAEAEIVGPVQIYDEDNNNSISVMVTFENKKFLFMGDTESKAEKDIIEAGVNLDCDVLKVSHHGSKSSTTDLLLDKTSPSIAVISCGKNNDYGHPHAKTLNKLLERNIILYRTDTQGTIILSVKDGQIFANVDNTSDFDAGKTAKEDIQTDNKEVSTYILNTSSKKFHYPDCKSVQDMKKDNREESNLDRETLIKNGYSPCGNCKP